MFLNNNNVVATPDGKLGFMGPAAAVNAYQSKFAVLSLKKTCTPNNVRHYVYKTVSTEAT
jgi:hypothetical protein